MAEERRSGQERRLSKHEPMPIQNEQPATWELVIADMKERHQIGLERYGTALQPVNGRNSKIDAYQEVLDFIVYYRNDLEDQRLFIESLIAMFYQAGYALPATRYDNFTQLMRDLKFRLDDIARTKQNHDTLYRERNGEVWFWSTGDPEDGDNVETITCPIMIQPETLRAIIEQGKTDICVAGEICDELASQLKQPVAMILHCPRCGAQHVDKEETDADFQLRTNQWLEGGYHFGAKAPERWTNPPHKSHLCHGCKTIWRPAEIYTVGVAYVKPGKTDTWRGR